MDNYIHVEVVRLEQLFSNRFHFHLPWFQRAYAWRDDNAASLLGDVREAMQGPTRRYCLGHILLAKKADRPEAAIIDGQQRLITLTILFALLRDLATGTTESARLEATIFDRGDRARRTPPHFRLTPQPSVAPLFERCVQRPAGTREELPGDVMDLSESERNIVINRNHMRTMLEEPNCSSRERTAIVQFLLNNCHVIVEALEDEQEAWETLKKEEETGLSHHSSERAKTTLISAMPREQQEAASRIWEECQILLGADLLYQLLGHMRPLRQRRSSPEPIESHLLQAYGLDRAGIDFMTREVEPRAKLFSAIRNRTVGEGAARTEITAALDTLSWLDHQRWIPPALHWLTERGAAHDETVLFFRRLDRMAWILKLSGTDPTDVERRFVRLIGEIGSTRPVGKLKELELESKKVTAALTNLRSRTFYAKRYCNYVLRRISRDLGQDPGPIDQENMTIEHVLPRKPAAESDWRRKFKTEDIVANYTNRLGNLVWLTPEENRRAGRLDYALKRPILAASVSLPTVQFAGRYETWGPDEILARTEELILDLFRRWDLPVR